MKIITTVQEMQQITNELRTSGKSIGFVSNAWGIYTKGMLRYYVKRAREENEIVVLVYL